MVKGQKSWKNLKLMNQKENDCTEKEERNRTRGKKTVVTGTRDDDELDVEAHDNEGATMKVLVI